MIKCMHEVGTNGAGGPVTNVKCSIMDETPPLTEEAKLQLSDYPVEDVVDGCAATVHVAYACTDAAFIYPITPSSAMAETYELWAQGQRRNIFGNVSVVKQLQSEAGAAGAVHGSLSVGGITTTFTASQGLLLMIPPMYKMAGELLPCVFHVSARAIAGQALSIFGDHSDVMAMRQCGWAMLSSNSVLECQDMAVVAHMATLSAKVPFVHFFDGFRTSHELQKIPILNYAQIRELMDFDAIESFRRRSLNPTHPYLKGSSQGPEVYFQNVEVAGRYYDAVPNIVESCMELFGEKVGRKYSLFEYHGNRDAEFVIVVMGAAGPVIEETLTAIECEDHKYGVVEVKLYRPWCVDRFVRILPRHSLKRICVLDRVKDPGALGEPLYLDVAASLQSRADFFPNKIICIGGRYGLGSKDFHPAMVRAVFDNLETITPKPNFTVGINDDILHKSLDYEKYLLLDTVPSGTTQCMFWGMGSDGTVGANKNVIKILGMNTNLYVQGYFAYSAHKAGGLTISHLRFGNSKIKSQYLVQNADYVAVHRGPYIQKYNCVANLKDSGTFVLNTNWSSDELEELLPSKIKRVLAEKNAKFYIIDANRVAAENGMGRRINNILMTAFFKLSGVLPFEVAINLFKRAIYKTYGKKGMHVVEANYKCVDAAVTAISEVKYDAVKWKLLNEIECRPNLSTAPPTFVENVMMALGRMEGDDLPVSAFKEFEGGIIPPGTAGWEKRGIAMSIPIVDMDKCTQCNHCAFVCPHSAIRPFLIDDDDSISAPPTFAMKKAKGYPKYRFRIQVSPYDCTGCELCYMACPDDALKMLAFSDTETVETINWTYAIELKDRSFDEIDDSQRITLKGSQFYQPMVEFSGACEGCGETPYVKLLTQLFGERLVIANATGCSSIWAASYPSNAYTTNQKGCGPAWGNSLFEDNAEYGYGMAISTAERRKHLVTSVEECLNKIPDITMDKKTRQCLQGWVSNYGNATACQKSYELLVPLIEAETSRLRNLQNPLEIDKLLLSHYSIIYANRDLIPKITQWIIGGDGWAYDIGFGGLDHVLASGVDVNVLVLDTEVYSNTGGQSSKATTMGAVHKFSSGGRLRNKKDLGAICMEYGDVYVASCSSSANMTQTIRAFVEAEAYEGTSVILAYSPCIEHQYIKPFNLQLEHCKLAVDSGYWPLYRFNPGLCLEGKNPFQLDSRKIKASILDLIKKENRFGSLRRQNPKLAQELELKLQEWSNQRFNRYKIRALGHTPEMNSANSNGENAWSILYGTETGNAEDVAKRIGTMLKIREVVSAAYQMDEIGFDDMLKLKNVIIICSTAGQGDVPGNAKELYHALKECNDVTALNGMTYCVMGLGDTSYVYFNKAAILFDDVMGKLGAQRLLPIGLGDDQAEEGYETALGDWLGQFWSESKIPPPKNLRTTPDFSQFHVEPVVAATPEYIQCVPLGCKLIKLDTNRRITPDDYDVDIRHVEFDLENQGIKYQLGDSLALWVKNDPHAVKDLCDYFSLNPGQWIKITGSTLSSKYNALFENPLTIYQLLEECLDAFGKPSRQFYDELWKYCTDESEKQFAKNLLANENKSLMLAWTNQEYLTKYELLKRFPSTKKLVDIPALIDLFGVIKPRYYSIASSQKFVGTDRLHLCIGVVEWSTNSQKHRTGLATGCIQRTLPVLSLPACIKSTAFNLPPTNRHPVIVAGLGTGLAPFRSFIQHRAVLARKGVETGPFAVYFGCRHKNKDFIYGEELKTFHEEGVITYLNIAFSRDQKEKIYVQNLISNNAQRFHELMVEQEGYFYLCGSAKQVPIDIRNAVKKVITVIEMIPEEEADNRITEWQIKGRYNVEAW